MYRARVAAAEKTLTETLERPGVTDDSPAVWDARQRVARLENSLGNARSNARHIWISLGGAQIKDMRDVRRTAKIAGDNRAFARVSSYAAKLNDILATKPTDAQGFLRLVAADRELALLHGVDRNLPPGSPGDWAVIVFSKHFWSGQEHIRDDEGNFVRNAEGLRRTRAVESPSATRFVPDRVTGQVDMSADFFWGKPGYTNFDYGFYDPRSDSWWHANNREFHDDTRPMRVFQSTAERFFTGHADFDRSVLCLGFVNKAVGRTTLFTNPPHAQAPNTPASPNAKSAKRSPMRRWVAGSGWSWSGRGRSMKSFSP